MLMTIKFDFGEAAYAAKSGASSKTIRKSLMVVGRCRCDAISDEMACRMSYSQSCVAEVRHSILQGKCSQGPLPHDKPLADGPIAATRPILKQMPL